MQAELPATFDANQYPQLAKFIQKFRCSQDIEQNKNKHYAGDQKESTIKRKQFEHAIII